MRKSSSITEFQLKNAGRITESKDHPFVTLKET